MRVLITGCCGFIGSHLCERLLKEGNDIFGIDNMNDYYDVNIKKRNLDILQKHENFTFFLEDIRETNKIEELKPDIVFHLAAMAGVRNSIKNPKLYFDVNVNGFINILEQSVKIKLKKLIYASSSSVYGLNKKIPFSEEDKLESCNSPYACSKLTTEILAKTYFQLYDLPSCGLRFFTVYGPRGRPDMAPYKFLKNIMDNKPIKKFGDGSSSRDYTYIDDIIQGIISTSRRKEKDYQIYNLGNNKPVSLNSFISTCENVVSKKAIIENHPYQTGDVPRTLADISKSKEHLNYLPETDLFSGLKKLMSFIEKEGNQNSA